MAADTSKIDDISMVTVSSRVMGEIIGVGDRQVRNLAEEGVLVRNSHGRYLLLKSVKNYIITLKLSKAGEKVTGDFGEEGFDYEKEKGRSEHSKAEMMEIKLQLIKGKVHKSEDVGAVITDMFTKFRSKMMALPSSLAPKFEGKGKFEVQEMLKEKIEEALHELADYNPADYYPEEYVDIAEDDFS